jgi:hypothetical protein
MAVACPRAEQTLSAPSHKPSRTFSPHHHQAEELLTRIGALPTLALKAAGDFSRVENHPVP